MPFCVYRATGLFRDGTDQSKDWLISLSGQASAYARQLVKWTAAAADMVRRPQGLVILIYHRIGGRTPVSVDLPRQLFAEQLAALASGWSPLTLDRAAEVLAQSTAKTGAPPVCV